ncbi:MAG: N-acetylmuramoyl-L-alanine amidase family protein [Verrucomicrobiales bacterium]
MNFRPPRPFFCASLLLLLMLLQACTSPKALPFQSRKPSREAQRWEASLGRPPADYLSPATMTRELNIHRSFIPDGRYGRRLDRPMKPRYVTIHSTQNYTGDAWDHARALKNGKLRGGVCGYLCWHFTVQDDVILQHLPTDERGEHADFDGPGNRYSIGIEMCEHRGDSRAETIDRTAKLTASLMYYHRIPLANVVPHYHWPRYKYDNPHKNCPHFLLDGGRPGPTWEWFKGRVKAHHDRLVNSPPSLTRFVDRNEQRGIRAEELKGQG